MQNGSNETWPEGDLFTWHGAELIIVISVMFSGIIGNSMVMYIYTCRIPGHTVTLIKRMLATLDLTSLLVAQPLLLYTILQPDSPNFSQVCVVASYVATTMSMSDSCLLITIAVDRYLRVCLMSRQGVGEQLGKKLFVGILLFIGLANTPNAYLSGKEVRHLDRYNIQLTYCFFTSQAAGTWIFHVYFGFVSLFWLFSLNLLFFLYLKMIKHIRHHTHLQHQLSTASRIWMQATSEKTATQISQEAMEKSVIVFIIITVLFLATCSLYIFATLAHYFYGNLKNYITPLINAIIDFAKYAPIFNNMANPIIYSFTSSNFRHEVYMMLWYTDVIKRESPPTASASYTH